MRISLLLLCSLLIPPSPGLAPSPESPPWRCPLPSPPASCACDLPHTLRCSGGDRLALAAIARALRDLPPPASVSLLDCSLANVTWLPPRVLQGVALHGLVVSSGQLRRVSRAAFEGLSSPLLALGLPNNALPAVPGPALAALRRLDRLDLSRNAIASLDALCFPGLDNLTFLDLSDNPVSRVAPGTFSSSLPALGTLRLRGTSLDAPAIASAFRGARALHELDLSASAVEGPLGPDSLPPLPALQTLSLARNNLTSVRRGALEALPALASLCLAHNQIDVLEDDAFLHLGTLVTLDLSHNRVVTVSGASLAHLPTLVRLDLAHNFLRALTADVVSPLRSLQELRLDDNDISMVAAGAMEAAPGSLRRLTLSDNPLNCDCGISAFASWLSSGGLPASDRATALCATPPALENGLLVEVLPSQLLCGDEPALTPPSTPPPATAPPGARLIRFAFDGSRVSLLWAVGKGGGAPAPYSCDALFVYEEVGAHEVLLNSSPLRCDSAALPDASRLAVALPAADLHPGHKYR
ncbi:leucine-rich repeats and immunoglobulin-like domains protein 1 [Hetaerina americana]|uniref:leucine-rich repeats and immunoglobulin-like domains protein 1 n=1 Tax=Hetaerina americana TaxID=62018 RepID=UPI003A7F1D28